VRNQELEAKGLKMNTRKTKVLFSCNMKMGWNRNVSGFVVYVRRKSAIIRFCATVARNGSISDVGVCKEVCIRQANHLFTEAVR